MIGIGMSALQPFAEDIWLVTGPTVRAALLPFPTRMVIVRLGDGSLWIDSPVTASDETLDEVESLGPVRHLVAPTPLHAWRLDAWCAMYPEALVWGPPNGQRGVSGRIFAAVAGISKPSEAELAGWNVLDDSAPAIWEQDLDQVVFRGNAFVNEVEFLHKPSGTLVVGDFIQNYRPVAGDLLGNFAKRAADVLDGGVPRDIQRSMNDKQLARSSLRKILSWDFDKLIVAHGFCLERDAGRFVEEAFRWLSP